MINISRKLLSEVLGVDVYKYYWTDSLKQNELCIEWNDNLGIMSENYNIHELADKAIDWIESQGFWIKKEHKEIYALMKGADEVYGIDTNKRLDVPFMCMQWILDSKN